FSLYASLANHSEAICSSEWASFHRSSELRRTDSVPPVRPHRDAPAEAASTSLPCCESDEPLGWDPPQAASVRSMLPAARTARDCRSLRGFISYLTRRCRSENCWSAAPAGLGPILPPIRMSLAVTKVIVNRNAISRKSFGAAARGRVDGVGRGSMGWGAGRWRGGADEAPHPPFDGCEVATKGEDYVS